MIPLKDLNPTRNFPIVNVTIIVINVLVFLYEFAIGHRVEALFASFAVIPYDVSSAIQTGRFDVAVVLPLFTSMFLHGGWMHLIGNMLYLWIFGDNIEDIMGRGRYVVFYLLCGIAASVTHIFIAPTSAIPTVGASGAISGVLGAYLLLFPRAKVVTLIPIFMFVQVARLPAIFILGFWFVMQFFNGLASLGFESAGMGGVAWWAHIGGFVAGMLLIWVFRKKEENIGVIH